MKIILHKVNEVYFKVECDISQSLELKEYLSCYAPNFQYHPKFKSKMWNGKVSFFTNKDHLLPIGLLPDFIRFCKKFDYDYKLNFDTSILSNDFNESMVNDFCGKIKKYYNSSFDLRDYQLEALIKAIQNKRGVIVLPTGCLDPKSKVNIEISKEDFLFLKASNSKSF